MGLSPSPQQQDEAPSVALNHLGILLVAPRIETAHINPDFLRYNEIVDPGWQIDPPVIIEPGLSMVQYGNGLSITATNDYLEISHRDAPLSTDEIASPPVASRYLAMAPWPLEYSAVRIVLNGSIDAAGQGIARRFSPLHRLSSGMLFHDTTPDVQARAVYQLEDKSITLHISESGDSDLVNSVRFNAHIHRDIDSSLSDVERIEFVDSVIKSWEDDFVSFAQFALQFYRNYGN